MPFQVTRSRILTKVPRVPPLVTVAEVAPPELLASSSGFIQRLLKPNMLLSTVWRDENSDRLWKLGYRFTSKRVPIACGRVRVIVMSISFNILQYSLQGTDMTYPLPALTFELMLFLFPFGGIGSLVSWRGTNIAMD